ncbi:MAG TPA: class I SAM-dependent methyltransferase, partial [Ktedonobacteraceae bacterium]|nr:class I SAM-dependent methyltransferase [Ktedonobacteraceae bacterium]
DLQESLNRSGASSELPDNYIFQAGNILKRLPFIDASFDFVHQRLLLANIPSVQWYAVLRELVRVTRPGGWLELLEGHTTVGNAGVATEIWFSWRDAAGKLSGLDFSQMSNLDLLVRQMGLSYTSHTIDLPLGAWAGELGLLVQECMLAVYDDSVARYRRLGVSEHELVTLRAQLPVEWQERCCQVSIFLVLIENKRL